MAPIGKPKRIVRRDKPDIKAPAPNPKEAPIEVPNWPIAVPVPVELPVTPAPASK